LIERKEAKDKLASNGNRKAIKTILEAVRCTFEDPQGILGKVDIQTAIKSESEPYLYFHDLLTNHMTEQELIDALFPLWNIDHIGSMHKIKKAPHYLAFIGKMCCAICGDPSIEIHHEPARSLGGSDYDTVALCKFHHDVMHLKADAARFKQEYGGRCMCHVMNDDLLPLVKDTIIKNLIDYISRREGR